MKIEIFIVESINEKCTGSTCFEAPVHIAKAISGQQEIRGIVIIDDVPVKFSFSSMGMDGDIFTKDNTLRTIVKSLIPMYIYSRLRGNTTRGLKLKRTTGIGVAPEKEIYDRFEGMEP